jgi:prepilin-type N-terminal cleavage/methylation domain-containing protein
MVRMLTTARHERARRSLGERGFGMMELIVVMGLIAVLSLLATPSFLTYMQSSALSAGADELKSVLNRGRALAITQNTSVCVQVTGTSVRYRTGSCAGTVWAGVGTDSSGVIRLTNSITVSGGTSAIFTNLGAASTTATYTVTHPKTSRTRSVIVASTGRVSIQ